ncbi:hypothetical protein G9F73_010425 [Clostridium estertheticum]|uniref:hypothetical protein n=1 Tax=Clostridium estertheticum TaxID=238834 RepID=UPI0013EEC89B|nr:hypothetical protein [Clostridium estertheticum]MBZ9608220.1 hypothetical protein [Clostridium estertheticum]
MKKDKVILKKYKVIIGSDEFECVYYEINYICIEFFQCGDENYNKIIPTNVVFLIYHI